MQKILKRVDAKGKVRKIRFGLTPGCSYTIIESHDKR